eukprot:3048794-Pyramimonas_sp.AAC.1
MARAACLRVCGSSFSSTRTRRVSELPLGPSWSATLAFRAIAILGSWERPPPSIYKVVSVAPVGHLGSRRSGRSPLGRQPHGPQPALCRA